MSNCPQLLEARSWFYIALFEQLVIATQGSIYNFVMQIVKSKK
jgi:hypothetical protein